MRTLLPQSAGFEVAATSDLDVRNGATRAVSHSGTGRWPRYAEPRRLDARARDVGLFGFDRERLGPGWASLAKEWHAFDLLGGRVVAVAGQPKLVAEDGCAEARPSGHGPWCIRAEHLPPADHFGMTV